MILARRYPEDTPPLYGQWTPVSAGGLLLPDAPGHAAGWLLPWSFITHWRLTSTPPPYPATARKTGWRDTYFYPPAHLQQVWLRRFPGDVASVQAKYDAPDGAFTITQPQGYSLAAPWYCFYQWKPM